ncbi:hypothetical protein IEN85_10765 [Pelagicoccus sp. NFK12]|uniref:Uncharacterized protein n=1 Tax=Pelagicoccus enzymogenes TaxID=2773457 RepID=A0A927IHZ3_9BACT|nr:hypothetical protein [Pelagicoccus enzymogenes]MBD5779970.1 hypothetical protein [Pelagicoccus enzymogenes]
MKTSLCTLAAILLFSPPIFCQSHAESHVVQSVSKDVIDRFKNPTPLDDREDLISIDYRETPVGVVIYDIASLYDRELITPPGLSDRCGNINIRLVQVTAEELLNIVVPLCGCTWKEDKNRIIVQWKKEQQS